MTVTQRLARRWVRAKTRLAYRWETATACWCGGRLGDSWDSRVGECRDCGSGVLLRRLTEDSYDRWYRSGDYRRWVMGTSGVSVGQLVKEMRRAQAAFEFLGEAKVPISGKTILDFGCGAGGALVAARLMGAASIIGVDSDPRARIIPEAFGIGVSDTLPPVRVDCILLSHVIEHAVRPARLLKMIGGLLSCRMKTGCVVYVETPEWTPKAEVKLPHPFYFRQESIMHLAANAGLEIISMGPGIQAVLRRSA